MAKRLFDLLLSSIGLLLLAPLLLLIALLVHLLKNKRFRHRIGVMMAQQGRHRGGAAAEVILLMQGTLETGLAHADDGHLKARAAEGADIGSAAFDRGRKFELYQQIDTLQEYLLIEQDRKHADLFRKNSEGLWVLHPAGEGDVVRLESVGVELALDGLYEDVEL